MSRPARARIDLDALRHNLRYAKELAGPVRVLAVVKANGYGHGALPVARALSGDADALGVACTEEALELRESGVKVPILLMEGVFSPDEIALADRHRLAMVVHSREQLGWILASRPSLPLDCWLKVDTGMHRVGLDPSDLPTAYGALTGAPQVGGLVLMTHFARADEPGHPFTARQAARFAELTAGLAVPRSLANSAAVIAWPDTHGDWVRPGIMLYGISPHGDAHPSAGRLRPVMHLESALIAVRELAAGETVGYGGRFVCPGATRVGVVAMGYADGYPRHATDGTPVVVRGRRARLIGRVSMDMLTVDLSGIENAVVGDPVELWGDQVSANAVASASGTIAYQLFTGISPRVPRIYASAEVKSGPGGS
ncbi:MAG: alanine racemase [Chromatiaceae bacterium]